MPELPLQGLLFLLGRKPGPNFQSTNLNSPFASCDNFVSALKSPPELFTAFDVTFSNYLKDSGPHTMTGNDATNWPITRASSLMVTDCFLFRSEHTDSIIFLQSSVKVTVMSSEFSQNPKFLLLFFFPGCESRFSSWIINPVIEKVPQYLLHFLHTTHPYQPVNNNHQWMTQISLRSQGGVGWF